MKKYIKPQILFETIDDCSLLQTSHQHLCDCFVYREYGGCIGCSGHCGCSHWDPELQEIIPGC